MPKFLTYKKMKDPNATSPLSWLYAYKTYILKIIFKPLHNDISWLQPRQEICIKNYELKKI